MANIRGRHYAAGTPEWPSIALPRAGMAAHLHAYQPGWTADPRLQRRRCAAAGAGARVQPRRTAIESLLVAPLALPARHARLGGAGRVARRRLRDQRGGAALLDAMARQATLALHHQPGASSRAARGAPPGRPRGAQPHRPRHPRHAGAGLRRDPDAAAGGAARRRRRRCRASVAGSLDTAVELARTHMVEARRSVVGAAAAAAGRGGRSAPPWPRLADLARRTSELPVELVVDALPPFGAGVEREIIGIAQEALTNAVRHSRAHRITVHAEGVRGVGFRLSVADDGRGYRRRQGRQRLRHDQHARAGRTDRRVAHHRHRAAARHRGGAGVGAAVVLDSERGRCPPVTRRRPGASRRRRPASCSSTTTRCCAPASPTSSTRSRSCEVIAEAGNGREAVDAFTRWRPDVTLMDLRMPEMEGVEAIRRIRAIDPQARVVVLTTYDADEDIARALAGRRQGLHPQGHRRRGARRLHPRRAGRQDLPGAGRRGQAGRARHPGAADAARTRRRCG